MILNDFTHTHTRSRASTQSIENCVFVCVREREREIDRVFENEISSERSKGSHSVSQAASEWMDERACFCAHIFKSITICNQQVHIPYHIDYTGTLCWFKCAFNGFYIHCVYMYVSDSVTLEHFRVEFQRLTHVFVFAAAAGVVFPSNSSAAFV